MHFLVCYESKKGRLAKSIFLFLSCSLNRNSPFAESYRCAVEHNARSRTGSADNPTRRTQQCKAAVDEILTTERTYVLRLNDVLKVSHDIV